MSVTVDQVPVWLMLRSIGHAVSCTGSGWHQAACGKVTPNGELTKTIPAKICRGCRARLREASLTSDNGK